MLMLSLDRLKLSIPSATSADDDLLTALGDAAVEAVRGWCGRDFTLTTYDALVEGGPGDRLLLRHYPVRRVDRVRGEPCPVLLVRHTGSESARANVTATALSLVSVTAGIATTQAVLWADNVTLQDVADADAALFGWEARVVPGWEAHPSADLAAGLVGDSRYAAGTWAGLELHTREVVDYRWHAAGWLEACSEWAWLGGTRAWRVAYQAGYDPVPPAVIEAAALWAAELFYLTARDPALQHQAVTGAVSQSWSPGERTPPARVVALLEPFRRRAD
jgi:hypothetical protein